MRSRENERARPRMCRAAEASAGRAGSAAQAASTRRGRGGVARRHELARRTRAPRDPGCRPPRVASTGRPAAIASRIEYGRPSQSVISANASQSASCAATSLAVAEQRHAITQAELVTAAARSPRGRDRRRTRAAPSASQPGWASASSSVSRSFGGASRAVQPSTRRAAGARGAAAGRAGASTPLWMTCRPRRGAMPRSRASRRSCLETHTIASVRGATARSLAAYTAPAAPSRPENAQPCAVNTVRAPSAGEREPGEHARPWRS